MQIIINNQKQNIMTDLQKSKFWTNFNWDLYNKYLRIKYQNL